MLSDPVFRSFSSQRPLAVMAQMALGRLLDAEVVDQLFLEHAQEQYQRRLLFSSLTQLLAAVVLGKHPSVNAAFRKEKDRIGVSLNALYGKLERVEPQVSQSLVRHSYQQAKALEASLESNVSDLVEGYHTYIFDGNHLAGTEHRLLETRGSTAAPLPGKSVVVLDPRLRAIKDYFPLEDGHSQERTAIDALLLTVQERDLWMGDRNFCTLKLLYGIAARNAVFVIRHHQKLEGEGLGRRHKVGKGETGMVYERTMKISPYQGERMTVRRIEIDLTKSTRNGDRQLVILTNLPPEAADGIKIAQLYQERWQIEGAFQTLTVSLHCELKALCFPRAALFTFALASVAYNAIAIVYLALLAEQGAEEADQLSTYYVAREIAETTDGMLIALPPERWQELSGLCPSRFTKAIRSVARQIDIRVYRKAPTKARTPPTDAKHHQQNVHTSTAKILAQRKQQNAC